MQGIGQWTKYKNSFQPFRIGSLELKNRIVMAPMTRSFSPGGVPASNVADYYVRRAKDEVGLIVSEGTVVNRPALQMMRTFRTSTAKATQRMEGRD